jgi:hypothetical protein
MIQNSDAKWTYQAAATADLMLAEDMGSKHKAKDEDA